MSRLPKGWAFTTIGEVADSGQYGWTTKAAESGVIRFLRTTDITKGVINWNKVPYCSEVPADCAKYQLEKNDVVISRAGSVGFSKILDDIPEPTVFASYLIRFKPSFAIEPKFFAAYLNSDDYWKGIGAASVGIALANVNAKNLAGLQIPLAPLPEQKRIADKLDVTLARVDACRERLALVAPILKRFRQSVLAAATSGQLTADWRELQGHGHAGNAAWADENSSRLAADDERWASQAQPNLRAGLRANPRPNNRELLVDEFAVLIPGFAFKSESFQKEGKYRVLKLANVKDGFVSLNSGDSYLPEDVALQSSKFMVKKDDILIAMTGTKYKRDYGFVALVNEQSDMFANQRVGIIRVNQSIVLASYAFICFRSELFRNQFFEGETGGVNQGNVGAGHIKSCKINVPPLAEQTEVVRRVDTLFAFADRLEARLASASAAAERLTPSLLAKAFRGELVPQDPNDEPASELLKRLAAQREAAGSKPKRGRKASS